MTKISTIILLCLFLASCEHSNKVNDSSKTIESKKVVFNTDSKSATILYNEHIIPWEISDDDINFPYNGETNKVAFATLKDTLRLNLPPGKKIPVEFIINKKDTIIASIIGASKQVSYNNKYVEENTGTYKVYLPQVHELVNIAIALTQRGRTDSNMVNLNSAYYKKVMRHFDEFKNHALIDSLNQNLNEDYDTGLSYYYNIKMNACMYSFKKNDIINNSPYNRLGFEDSNYLKELIPFLIDFSEKSNFKKFYQENMIYYQSLINDYHKFVPVMKMWKWIENKFPNKHQSYKIYFSPLVQGAHSTQNLSDNGFSETFMFINAPIIDDSYSEKEKEAFFSRIVFTEIDHNYVNPMSSQFNETGSIFNQLKCWNSNESEWYGDSSATFNEYMTWAIYTLYMYNNFDADTFEKANRDYTSVMVNGRGFPKFKEFNSFVLNWYKNSPKEPIKNLYPEIFKWIKKQKCNQ